MESQYQRTYSLPTGLSFIDSKSLEDLVDIVSLTSDIFEGSFALITVLEKDHFNFLAKTNTQTQSAPIDTFFCTETLKIGQSAYVIENTKTEYKPVFIDGKKISFYAGCPIVFGKSQLQGTLCILDTSTRLFNDHHKEILASLAKRVERIVALSEEIHNEKEANSQLKYLNQSSHELVCQHRPDGIYEYVSPSVEFLLGYSSSDLIGKSPYVFFHPDDAERIRNTTHAEALNKVNAGEVVYRYKKKDGIYIYLSTVTDVILDDDNNVQKIITRSRDVTEKVKAEEQLKLNIEAIKTIYQATNNANGQEYLDNCVKALQDVLNADIVFIGEYLDKSNEIKTLSFRGLNGKDENITYDIKNTPCEIVKNEGSSIFEKNIHSLFPLDQMLVDIKAESYLGGAIRNENGEFTGIVSALFLKPIENIDFKQSLLDLVSRNLEIELYRQQLQEKNIAYDKYLSLVNENTNELISVVRGDRLEFVSPSFKKLFGFEEKDVLGISIKEIIDKIHPEDRDGIFEKIKTAHRQKTTELKYTYRALTKSGFIWLEDSVKIEYDIQGNHIGSYIIGRDITERLEYLKRIHESETKFKSYFQFNPAATYIWKRVDDDFVLVDVNEAVNKLSEGKSNLFLSKSAKEIYNERPDIQELMLESFKSQKNIEKSIELNSKYIGKTLFLNYKFSYVDSDTLIVVIEDLTYLKKSETEIRLSEEKYRFLVENTSDLVVMLNFKGEFEYISPNVEELTGFTLDEYKQFDGFDNVHPDDVKNIKLLLSEMAGGKSKAIAQYRIKRKDGRYMWIQTRSRVILNSEGQVSHILTNSSDITELKKYEEELLNAKLRAEKGEENLTIKNLKIANQNLELSNSNTELKKANHELDSFVYRASHDLRSPISSALGLANLMKMTNDITELKKYGSLQEERLKLLDKFIRDILDYSRNARQELKVESVNLKEVIDDILKEVQYVIDQNEIIISTEFDIQPNIHSDKLRLTIILKNIISNAIKFHKSNSEQSFIKIMIKPIASGQKIIIKDNGIGMKDESLDKIFNMFYRATDITSGSGLGLYMVKECVEKLNGGIKVESKYGSGTSFIIELPFLNPLNN